MHHRSDNSLTELAQMYNPCIRGWIIYYGHFYRTQLRPTLKRIDAYVIRWARRKFKRMRVCQLCGVFLVLPYVATLENKALAAAAARQRLLDRSVSPEDAGQRAVDLARRTANLRPGTVLGREWNGQMQRVAVLADGFAWNGKTYPSLSKIAFAITGTRWSGPKFFGMRDKPPRGSSP